MKTTMQPPGKRPEKNKVPVKPTDREDVRDPGSTSGKDREDQDSGKPSEEEAISHWRNPVTNQDEQEKITNTGGDDIPIPNK